MKFIELTNLIQDRVRAFDDHEGYYLKPTLKGINRAQEFAKLLEKEGLVKFCENVEIDCDGGIEFYFPKKISCVIYSNAKFLQEDGGRSKPPSLYEKDIELAEELKKLIEG